MSSIRIRLFAVLRDRFGAEFVALDLAPGTTARALLQRLAVQYPDHARHLSTCRVAVNHRFASDTEVVAPEDEVALIPPVSGG
ncbi:MAG: molybdopterin converting factor subunit 1 [Candidatus Wallbacteria bacterium]|nr:molybdopterin converting factor subunit 1 [Candidatus Wallbacteria bacterium]